MEARLSTASSKTWSLSCICFLPEAKRHGGAPWSCTASAMLANEVGNSYDERSRESTHIKCSWLWHLSSRICMSACCRNGSEGTCLCLWASNIQPGNMTSWSPSGAALMTDPVDHTASLPAPQPVPCPCHTKAVIGPRNHAYAPMQLVPRLLQQAGRQRMHPERQPMLLSSDCKSP